MEATPSEQKKDYVKERFLDFLKAHGIDLKERSLQTQDAGLDNKAMKKGLECGVRLLLTKKRIAQRDELMDLLIKQSELYLSSRFDEVEKYYDMIDRCLEEAAMGSKGIENEVDVGTPELHKAVLKAKGDCNAVNVGKTMGNLDELLPKKIAVLECALRNATIRANVSDIEEVVGYATDYMSMVNGSSIGSVIIKLHDDTFPYLAMLQKERRVADPSNCRAFVDCIETMIKQHVTVEQRLVKLERRIKRLTVIYLLVVGMVIVWAFH